MKKKKLFFFFFLFLFSPSFNFFFFLYGLGQRQSSVCHVFVKLDWHINILIYKCCYLVKCFTLFLICYWKRSWNSFFGAENLSFNITMSQYQSIFCLSTVVYHYIVFGYWDKNKLIPIFNYYVILAYKAQQYMFYEVFIIWNCDFVLKPLPPS